MASIPPSYSFNRFCIIFDKEFVRNSYRVVFAEIEHIKTDIRIHPTVLTVLVHPPVAALDIVRDFRLVAVTQVHVAALADFACEIAD